VSVATGGAQLSFQSTAPVISDSGDAVLFLANARSASIPDALLHAAAGSLVQASIGSGGAPQFAYSASMSGDASLVAFERRPAGPPVRIYTRAMDSHHLTLMPPDPSATHPGSSALPVLSRDGSTIAYYSRQRTNQLVVVAVDLATMAAQVAPAPAVNYSHLSPPSLSANGAMVAFTTQPTGRGKSTVVVWNRALDAVTRVATGAVGSGARSPSLSADGRFVAFAGGDGQVYVTDLMTHRRKLVSGLHHVPGNGFSFQPSISADGTRVAFTSFASDLVAGDTNAASDVLVADLGAHTI